MADQPTSPAQDEAAAPSPFVARARLHGERWLRYADTTFIGRTWQRLLEIEFVDRSIALAAKSFVSLFPLLVVVSAFAPDVVGAGIRETMLTRFGISGDAQELVEGAFGGSEAVRSSAGVLGVILTVLFAVSFTTALQRVYLRTWRRPPRGGLRDKRRGLVWLAMVIAFLAFVGTLARVFVGAPGTVVAVVVSAVTSMGAWWWTAHTMLRGDVRWRPLLPTALLSGAGSWVYAVAASVWMPRVMENNVAQFGFIGVALSFVTWMTGFAFLLVLAAAVGPPLAEGDSTVGRWLRGPDDDVLGPGAARPLPGPVQTPRLLDILGRRDVDGELHEH